MRNIKYIIVHCSDSPDNRDSVDAAEIRRWHTSPPRNWRDIGYHYVIKRDGTVEHGRQEEVVGAHCEGYNQNSIGICLVGGVYGDGRPNNTNDIGHYSPAQIKSLHHLCLQIKQRHPQAQVEGHRHFNSDKTCPNFDVQLLGIV